MAGPTADEEPERVVAEHPQLLAAMQFKEWAIFLPRLASLQVELNSSYILNRQGGNPKFFDHMRKRLEDILHDFDVLQVSGKSVDPETGLVEAVDTVLQSLIAAHGFAGNRQFHKAVAIGELCVQVSDRINFQFPALVFWPLLCRLTLGDAYLRLRRRDEACQLLRGALQLGEAAAQAEALPQGQKSLSVVVGACRFLLARAAVEAQEWDAALRHIASAIEEIEGNIWYLSESKEDKESMSSVVATCYHFKGNCDFENGNHEMAMSWYGRALKCLESYRDLGSDFEQISAQIKLDIERAECLKPIE
eukprot:TRINITY_DN43793_c0_g1_i1.p1 TRINITY_DN43793_c0_g1~~TRINITY_DN43793_c0_g1_i1.p1  ORF type:complete len:316 (-),score=79.05 TRINITY_DN43793_c0_g1_i1:43-960(-)